MKIIYVGTEMLLSTDYTDMTRQTVLRYCRTVAEPGFAIWGTKHDGMRTEPKSLRGRECTLLQPTRGSGGIVSSPSEARALMFSRRDRTSVIVMFAVTYINETNETKTWFRRL